MGYSYKRTKRSRKNKLRKNKRNSKKYGGSSKRYSRYMRGGGVGLTPELRDQLKVFVKEDGSVLPQEAKDLAKCAELIVGLIYSMPGKGENDDALNEVIESLQQIKSAWTLDDGAATEAAPNDANANEVAPGPGGNAAVAAAAISTPELDAVTQQQIQDIENMTLEAFLATPNDQNLTLSEKENAKITQLTDGTITSDGFATMKKNAAATAAAQNPADASKTPFEMILASPFQLSLGSA